MIFKKRIVERTRFKVRGLYTSNILRLKNRIVDEMQFQQHGSYCNENIPNPVNLLSIDQQNLFSAIISGQLDVFVASVNPIQ